jgi:8-oxo-dGTP pyrophosphatase MutT (NUDIX family)
MAREYSRGIGLIDDLRNRLIAPEAAVELDAYGTTDAAVLVPLYEHHGDIHAVFTRRREDLRRHAGEISFPGGRQDTPEEDLRVTATREACEEIGLPPDEVEIIGALQPTSTMVTGYSIYPFVGVISAGRRWELSPQEVAEVLELSFGDLRAGHARQRLLRRGLPIRTDTYTVDGNLIWGATARILSDLLERVRYP